MINPNSRIAELIGRHLNGTISELEGSELNEWIASSAENRQLFDRYNNEQYVCTELEKHYHFDVQAGWEKLIERANIPFRRVSPVVKLRWLLSAAAAVLLLAVFTWIFITSKPISNSTVTPTEITNNNDIAPGGDRAKLVLADGTIIVLDSATNGALAKQGGTQVTKTRDGSLKYEVQNAKSEVLYNTLSTPRGGKYQIVLPDGSKVWLNAESSIKYPNIFTGKRREVEVTGELYFEVEKNKAFPFAVISKGLQIEVTGTSFNVQAYSNEPMIRTTLLEGGVRITPLPSSGSSEVKVLKPGQQAQIKSGKSIAIIDNVDLEEVLAWKNDMFAFNNTDIKVLMRQLERWYDIEVAYRGTITDLEFLGKIPRSMSLSQVLTILEKQDVHFRIEGKKIIVSS